MFSVRVVIVLELDITVNYIQILTVAQQCFYGKFTLRSTIEIISIFLEKLRANKFALSRHVTYTGYIETNGRMLRLLFRPSLTKPTVN
jgi:hypothetical protein